MFTVMGEICETNETIVCLWSRFTPLWNLNTSFWFQISHKFDMTRFVELNTSNGRKYLWHFTKCNHVFIILLLLFFFAASIILKKSDFLCSQKFSSESSQLLSCLTMKSDVFAKKERFSLKGRFHWLLAQSAQLDLVNFGLSTQ